MTSATPPTPRLLEHHDSPRAIPRELLAELVEQKFTGQLTIRNPFDEMVDWQIYLSKGKINFATSAVGNGRRLNYMLGPLFRENNIRLPHELENDYDYICELWKKKCFSFQQARSVLTQFSQEALVQTLSLPKAQYQLQADRHLEHLFLNLSLDQAVIPIEKKINYWWELRAEVSSPFQRPLVHDWQKLGAALVRARRQTQSNFWEVLKQSLQDLHCLYDIAGATGLSTLQLAIALRNLIKAGDITMLPYQEINVDSRPLVVSVDEHEPHHHIVRYVLENNGYRVNTIADPFKALALLQGQNPSLILINADMEKMDGYQLASLCRKSPQLRQVPIIMMVEQNNLVQSIKTKMCGANDNLQKPFLPQDLLGKVKGNVPSAHGASSMAELTAALS